MKIIDGCWEYDDLTNSVISNNPTGSMMSKVCDIRGWGYLTGKGSLGLAMEEAENIQRNTGELIASAPALLRALRAVLSEAVDDYYQEVDPDGIIQDAKALSEKLGGIL